VLTLRKGKENREEKEKKNGSWGEKKLCCSATRADEFAHAVLLFFVFPFLFLASTFVMVFTFPFGAVLLLLPLLPLLLPLRRAARIERHTPHPPLLLIYIPPSAFGFSSPQTFPLPPSLPPFLPSFP